MKKNYVYDIETFINYFSVVFVDVDSDESFSFEVYNIKNIKKNQINDFFDFLHNNVKGLIGYNNLKFDYPVLHSLLNNEKLARKCTIEELLEYIYVRAQSIIDKKGRGIFTDRIKIPQLDLMKMNYFDSKAKATSLKHLQFVMRYKNVQDLPYKHNVKLKRLEQAEDMLLYNMNDVLSTKEFYKVNKEAIDLRKKLSFQYNTNLINHSETGLGKEAFAYELCRDMNISRFELNKMRTERNIIDVGKEVILPIIEFKSPCFKNLLEFYKLQKMNKLKGFFKDIEIKRSGYEYIREYVYDRDIKKNGTIENLSVVFRDHVYVFGSGGIHSYFEGKVVKECDNYCILDIDVKSYYPNLAILFGFKPAHLGDTFSKTYKQIYEERLLFDKGTPENYIKKIQLNASYGLSNNEHSFLYDPLMTAQICINGQLLLTMLIEQVLLETDSECIMANTDGAAFKINRKDLEKVKNIVSEFSSKTGLVFEDEMYSAMYFRDVNNYIWIPLEKDKQPKLKGCFDHNRDKKGNIKLETYHKDHGNKVVIYALIEHFLKGSSIEQYIRNHKDIYDFCKEAKGKSNSKFYLSSKKEDLTEQRQYLGKVTRYYVTNYKNVHDSTLMFKEMPPIVHKSKIERLIEKHDCFTDMFEDQKEDINVIPNRIISIEAGYYVQLFNVYEEKDIKDYNINYDYYIKECRKVLEGIKGSSKSAKKNKIINKTTQNQLFL